MKNPRKTMIKLMDKLMLDCQEATFLISKKLDAPIGFLQAGQLKLHLMYCKYCQNFDVQSNKIDKILKNKPEELSQKEVLSAQKKKEITKKLKEKQ